MEQPKFFENSWHYRDGFKNQFERTYRWLLRIQDIQNGQFMLVRRDDSLQRDYLLAFFNCCFSIRDWVKVEREWSSIERFVNENPYLMICRDIANVSKHKTLNSPSVDANFSFMTATSPTGHRMMLAISGKKLVEAIGKIVEKERHAAGETFDIEEIHRQLNSIKIPTRDEFPFLIDALLLAEATLDTWETFLIKAKLLSEEEVKTIKSNAFFNKGF